MIQLVEPKQQVMYYIATNNKAWTGPCGRPGTFAVSSVYSDKTDKEGEKIVNIETISRRQEEIDWRVKALM